jgi:hypothetical protein
LISIFAGTCVAPFCVGANRKLVTIVRVTISTFILIHAFASTVAKVETGIAFTQTLQANRIVELDTVGIELDTFAIVEIGGFVADSLGGR